MARTTFSWLAGLALLALALEVLLRMLPVSTSTETGYYSDPLILTYPPHHRWTMSTGWDLRNAQTLEANNSGYAASRDFVLDQHAVALIGDSYIEASMLEAADRPGAQLERALGSRSVFAMGSPGTALLDFAERIRFANDRFGVRDFVLFMGRSDVLESLCGSGNVNGPCLDPKSLTQRVETLPQPGMAKRVLRRSALAQYLFSQIRFSPEKILRQVLPVQKPAATSEQGAVRIGSINVSPGQALAGAEIISETFFARIKPYVPGRLVIVMDCDRRALYSGQMVQDPARNQFMQIARAAGAIVVDTEPSFRAHLNHSSLKLDVSPSDGHLNALGVGIFVTLAAQALSQP